MNFERAFCGGVLPVLAVGILIGCSNTVPVSPRSGDDPTQEGQAKPPPTNTSASPTVSGTSPPPTSPTPRPAPTGTATPGPRADLTLTVEDCLQTFCPPPWLDQQAQSLLGIPGIVDAMALDETRVRVLYNPEELTEAEVTRIFEESTGLKTVP